MDQTAVLGAVDYVIFIAVLGISSAVGLYFAFTGGRQKTTSEYLLGDRKLHVLPVSMSMFMSFFSAIYILGRNAEVYRYGTQVWVGTLGSAVGYGLSAVIFVPLFYPLKLTSIFQFIDDRFKSKVLHYTVVATQITFQVTYMGMTTYAPATALEAVTRFPSWASILVCSAVTCFYTTIGGMKAVVWTDLFQGLVLLGGLLGLVIATCVHVGGISRMWQLNYDGGRIIFFNMDPDPTTRVTFWPVFIGSILKTMAAVGTAQAHVQRYCSLPTMKEAKIAMLLNIPFHIFLTTLTVLGGSALYAYNVETGCDPYRSGQIKNANQLLPHFILNVLGYPGVPGLFMAILFSGAFSSISSSLNSLAAVTWKDIIEQHYRGIAEHRKALITKFLVLMYGIIGLAFAFLINILPGTIEQIAVQIMGSTSSPVKGTIVVGSFFPFANWIGATFGAILSIVFTMIMNVANYITVPHRTYLNTIISGCNFTVNTTAIPMPTDPPGVFWLFRVTHYWISPIGVLTCVITALIISVFTGLEKAKDKDPRLIIPLFDRFCPWLPINIRQYLWCGVEREKEQETDQQTKVPLMEIRSEDRGISGTENHK